MEGGFPWNSKRLRNSSVQAQILIFPNEEKKNLTCRTYLSQQRASLTFTSPLNTFFCGEGVEGGKTLRCTESEWAFCCRLRQEDVGGIGNQKTDIRILLKRPVSFAWNRAESIFSLPLSSSSCQIDLRTLANSPTLGIQLRVSVGSCTASFHCPNEGVCCV